jgi:hypothetical protein
MDLLFLEELDVKLNAAQGRRCMATAYSVEDSLRMALEIKGIELVDYGTVVFVPTAHGYTVQARSKAWREKAERKTAPR